MWIFNMERRISRMGFLKGYAMQTYHAGRQSCGVKMVAFTRYKSLKLTYYFDDVPQETDTKTHDSSYKGLLHVRVKATTGETLILDEIDFVWNSEPLLQRRGDSRNGQKGAVIELFGWLDEDIAKECKHITEAGYLSVKLFPHQEQLMSD